MADVFVARDQLLGRPVAVKVLFPEYATDPKFVERFRREAQAAASLNHPNIVSIYDWGEEMGTYYIVMEYVEGQSLAQILRRDGQLTAEQVTRVALDMAHALGFAHDGGVVHRDVKPGNVLVSPKGEMKVADFGIATAMTANADANLTQTGAVMGTATYFSPEQAQGMKVDHRSDLYSLGVVMYEMLTGAPPFTGETPVSIAYKHVQEPVTPVSEKVDVPRALAAITMKLLSKNPDNRYPSAEALLADLDRFRQGQAIAAAAAAGSQQPHPGVTPPMQQTTALPAQQAPQGGGTRMIPQSNTYTPPPRRRGGLIFAGLLTSLLILAGFLILLQGNFGNSGDDPTEPTAVEVATVQIPTVGGRGEADARSTLEAQQLVVDRRLIADDGVAAGQVILTEPAAGSTVNVGSTVTMVVSTGANSTQIPSVLTLSENDALQTLQSAGFLVSIQRVTSSVAPEGEVVGQDPQGGSLLPRGGTVTIQVSAGTEEIPIPDVRGQELADARTFLESEGFSVEVEFEFEFDNEIPKNSVVDTNPPAGALLPPGGSIALILSDGPEALFLPSWIGIDRDIVFIELDELGLVGVEFGQVVQDPNLWGKVVDTIPAPNSFVEPGNQIQIIVGLPDPNAGTPPVQPTVPNPVPQPTVPNPVPQPTVDPSIGGQGDGTDPDTGFDN